MTHTEQTRNSFSTLQQQVCSLLYWSEEQYCAFMEKCGKLYLQHYIPRDPQGIDMLVGSKTFWSWWRTNWYQRDAAFAWQPGINTVTQQIREAIYLNLHDPATLAACIYPSGVVLSDSYAGMIQNMIDEKEAA